MPVSSERIDLAPHCSLTRSGALLFFGGVCFGSLSIAVLMTAMGYWPVLPFAGAEMLLLGWALKVSMARRHHTQSIFIDEAEVRVETRDRAVVSAVVFPRYWARVKLSRAGTPLHPSRLTIGSHGRACEVGQFLTEEERRSLAQRLTRAIAIDTARVPTGLHAMQGGSSP